MRVFPSLVISLVVAIFLFVLRALFLIPVLYLCSGCLEEHRSYHRLVLLSHKLARPVQ